MAAVAVGLAFVLQQLADPSPLFWAVPREAMEFALSTKVRANHFWLHRTQNLARGLLVWSAKVDGFATRDGFVLMGSGLDATAVRWSSEFSWRSLCQQSCEGKTTRGCKTTRFLLALCFVAGGLIVLNVVRRLDLASAFLLSAVCCVTGYGLAGPAEKFLNPWAELISLGDDKMCLGHLEVEPFAVPHSLWSKGCRAFRVRRVVGEEISSGKRT